MAASKVKPKPSDKVILTLEQQELAAQLTRLQRETVIGIECHGLSQVKAYQRAGGKAKGKAAESTSSRMLSFAKVKAFKESFAVQSTMQGVMTRDEALRRLSIHARIKITDICTFKVVELKTPDDEIVLNTVWEIKNAEDIDPDIAACIKSVTFTKSGPKIELYDANGSIKLLSEMQGWNAAQKHDITTKGQSINKGRKLSDFYGDISDDDDSDD